EAEQRAGIPCGAMDQAASVMGGAILFNGATQEVKKLAPALGRYAFAVVDSGVRRSLATSSYRLRVDESTAALAAIKARFGWSLSHLAEMTTIQLDVVMNLSDAFISASLKRRVRHVVSESKRVEEGTQALLTADWFSFGRLMTASGRSSARDYEISHPRVEELVEEMLTIEGVLGARMMGGGEGGAVLALVDQLQVPALRQTLYAGYLQRYGMVDREDLIHTCGIGAGARVGSIASLPGSFYQLVSDGLG
ncbi:MAG: hypothetical protein M3R06_09705, partial [Chloroflexota bacterium]|nr:hypothetical protein [Chloroflexota bacterium]